MALRLALVQSIKEEEWVEMHEKLEDVPNMFGVKQDGQSVAGSGNVVRRRLLTVLKGVKGKQERVFDRKCVLREGLMSNV